MSAAPDGSLARRTSPRADLLAFDVRAKITKPDIEWMASQVDDAMKAHGEIDMLIIMSDFEGAELGATFDGYAVGVEARSVAYIRRYVVVGGPAFVRVMIKLSGLILPLETKTFDLADEQAAWAWLEREQAASAESPARVRSGLHNPE